MSSIYKYSLTENGVIHFMKLHMLMYNVIVKEILRRLCELKYMVLNFLLGVSY